MDWNLYTVIHINNYLNYLDSVRLSLVSKKLYKNRYSLYLASPRDLLIEKNNRIALNSYFTDCEKELHVATDGSDCNNYYECSCGADGHYETDHYCETLDGCTCISKISLRQYLSIYSPLHLARRVAYFMNCTNSFIVALILFRSLDIESFKNLETTLDEIIVDSKNMSMVLEDIVKDEKLTNAGYVSEIAIYASDIAEYPIMGCRERYNENSIDYHSYIRGKVSEKLNKQTTSWSKYR